MYDVIYVDNEIICSISLWKQIDDLGRAARLAAKEQRGWSPEKYPEMAVGVLTTGIARIGMKVKKIVKTITFPRITYIQGKKCKTGSETMEVLLLQPV